MESFNLFDMPMEIVFHIISNIRDPQTIKNLFKIKNHQLHYILNNEKLVIDAQFGKDYKIGFSLEIL
jgi:hypothetical protein